MLKQGLHKSFTRRFLLAESEMEYMPTRPFLAVDTIFRLVRGHEPVIPGCGELQARS